MPMRKNSHCNENKRSLKFLSNVFIANHKITRKNIFPEQGFNKQGILNILLYNEW